MGVVLFGVGLCILLFSVIVHEVAHAYVADRYGDPTPRLNGRLSFNILVHLDPIGSLLLPLLFLLMKSPVLFAWAKPVPINPYNLKRPKEDMIWIAAAGPLVNLSIAIVTGMVMRIYTNLPIFLLVIFKFVMLINLTLCIFNLLPIPPLDGYRVVYGLLPYEYSSVISKIEPFGVVILLVLLFSGALKIVSMIVLNLAAFLSGTPLFSLL